MEAVLKRTPGFVSAAILGFKYVFTAQNNKPISTYSLLLLHLTLGTKD
jgi:hypothetical protein